MGKTLKMTGRDEKSGPLSHFSLYRLTGKRKSRLMHDSRLNHGGNNHCNRHNPTSGWFINLLCAPGLSAWRSTRMIIILLFFRRRVQWVIQSAIVPPGGLPRHGAGDLSFAGDMDSVTADTTRTGAWRGLLRVATQAAVFSLAFRPKSRKMNVGE